ncbi:hypothetical protein [Paenibacillus terrigena]|uniref:hypothetical protein n=1 Tax=Paenibacillus terrigena TaxID=369333 RepID=UPI0003814D4A|nr:hypothetical protein [Paenibacillus terrigena]
MQFPMKRFQYSKIRTRTLLFILAFILILAINIFYFIHTKAKYTYHQVTATNGISLHVLHTTPDHIQLKAIDSNVTDTGDVGINGGFFYGQDILSIAVQNHIPVKDEPRAYGSGWYNTKYDRGTLVWDGYQKQFTVQSVKSVEELDVFDRSQYWAQGGVSMNLANDFIWGLVIYYQALPAAHEARLRSGLVYDSMNQLYLVVTPTPCTADQFRQAIQEQIAPGQYKEGIFLDGDGSSQLASNQSMLTGDHRKVLQMISIE